MANETGEDPRDNKGDDIREVVLITGSSGHIGSAVIDHLAGRYTLVGLDRPGPPNPDDPAHCIPFDITSEDSVASAIAEVREKFGKRIASVIHLAAFYSFKGDPNPLYETVNVAGTAR
ncbi:MAG: NAD(P)-dependent oxidoreductase, partial [Proteobacteria bacterium]|nr:NAD(P)-dependent oxidoreductase [Pseudomonadota bacterium]